MGLTGVRWQNTAKIDTFSRINELNWTQVQKTSYTKSNFINDIHVPYRPLFRRPKFNAGLINAGPNNAGSEKLENIEVLFFH